MRADFQTPPVPQRRLPALRSDDCRWNFKIQIQIEGLPEGVYLTTCYELPGLVAQGRTVAEALETARDVACKLVDARREREEPKQ